MAGTKKRSSKGINTVDIEVRSMNQETESAALVVDLMVSENAKCRYSISMEIHWVITAVAPVNDRAVFLLHLASCSSKLS